MTRLPTISIDSVSFDQNILPYNHYLFAKYIPLSGNDDDDDDDERGKNDNQAKQWLAWVTNPEVLSPMKFQKNRRNLQNRHQ